LLLDVQLNAKLNVACVNEKNTIIFAQTEFLLP